MSKALPINENQPGFTYREQEHLITQMRSEIAELKRQNELQSLIYDASIDRVIVLDKQQCVIEWNKSCEIITGITRQEITGKNLLQQFSTLNECQPLKDAISMALTGMKMFVAAEDGPVGDKYSEHHLIPLRDHEDNIIGVLYVIHDISHRIKLEQQLIKNNRALQQKNEELLSFSHITSHDLKEPLRKIFTFSDLVSTKEASSLSVEGKKYLERIQLSVKKMATLIDDLHEFSQIGLQQKMIEPVDVNDLIGEVQNNLEHIIKATHAEISVDILPSINGYPGLLFQLFQNIIHNALKFQATNKSPLVHITGKHLKALEIMHPDAIAEMGYVCISISDNGIGFEKDYGEQIFKIFKRLNSTEVYPGSGMGLAVCNKIIQFHQGFITVDSKPGKGSTFHCHFPDHMI